MNILISACLTGCRCRYDGENKNTVDLTAIKENHRLFPVCPEVDGGLLIPREPSEIIGERVVNRKGEDVTEHFFKGAYIALKCAEENNCTAAILKARSPSCGKGQIYDGTFSSKLTEGDGILAGLLKKKGIKIYTEDEIDILLKEQS